MRVLFLIFILSGPAWALTPAECQCVIAEAKIELAMAPIYDWGEAKLKAQYPDTWQQERLKQGASGDCSGKVWAIFFRCGKLVSRITAKEMAAGKGGWKGHNVAFSKAKQASLAFFTFKPILRVNGHVGILLDDTRNDYNTLGHASQENNKFMRVGMGPEVDNAFWKHLNEVREID